MKKILSILSILITFNCYTQTIQVFTQGQKFNKQILSSIDKQKKSKKSLNFDLGDLKVEAQEVTMQKPEVFTQGKGGRKK